MKFTAQEEYGLRCLLQIARREGEAAMTIPEIARLEGLSTAYVGKLMRALRAGGLVESTRGQNGGYVLARPSSETNLNEVLMVLGGEMFPKDHCKKHAGTEVGSCVHLTDCSIRSAWSGLEVLLSRLLQGIKLKDLVRSEGSMDQWIQGLQPVPRKRLNIVS